MTFRVRLTLWHMAAMIVVLAIYAAAVLTLVTRQLSGTLDARLRSDYRWATSMAERAPDGSLTWFEGDPWNEESPWLQVWTPDGRELFRTAVAWRLPVPESEALASAPDGRIVAVPAEPAPFRILTERTTVGGDPVVIQVGRSEALMREEVRDLALLLALGLPLSVAATGLGGYWLARRALAPIDRMTERAREITARRLHDRLPVDQPNDELGRLAFVFNEMLARLESSFAEMRRFTSNVSHELRTPLTAIRSVGEVSLRGGRDAAAYRATVESMLEEADRLATLVERLLTVARADQGDRPRADEPIDLGTLADAVVEQLAVLAEEKEQSLTVTCNGDKPVCRGDRIVLRQALVNLVDNAIRYTPTGGSIDVRVDAVDGDSILDVRDNGPGVPESRATALFDRLHHDPADPTNAVPPKGLGLAIARWAVEAHHGRLTYSRTPTDQTTFRITLPST
ncbi:MAG: HAMP domain-containing protein [Acidobacteria bacterium]|nr:HAMP domain-containing protein [Acidobacteriota bacterium]MYD69824.1 HAMP domain-containing protein [Acidobacteriota bacterium]